MSRPTVVSAIDAAFRTEWPRLIATLNRELRDLQLAEDVTQEAFAEASVHWRRSGIPDRPGAWLLTTARRKAIDSMRRATRFDERLPALAEDAERQPDAAEIADDQLALIFGCCHPALAPDAQVALTLRSVGGLSTTQIAHAFLVPEPTMAKRLVRAKKKIQAAAIPFTVPDAARRTERLSAVCGVIYAIFTEGHASTSGTALLRGDLCDEAVWLAETLVELMPAEAEVRSLAALCLLVDSRRAGRVDAAGNPVLLADQDRSVWDADKTHRGMGHLAAANAAGAPGPYRLQAAIAALHSTAPTFEDTDWAAIVDVYDLMLAQGAGPVVSLNRAVAVAERDGAEAGLALLSELSHDATLEGYHYFHIARAELLARVGHREAAVVAFDRALRVCENDAERGWIERRRSQLD
ncbi:MAG: RNA polymerase sigma factor [Acidimicrobiales bacterium]